MGWLSSFFGFDDKPQKPTVVQQTSKIPEELAPFIKEILGEAQTLYAAQKERGYDPYTGETIAPLTPEELEAKEGLKGLVGTTRPYLEEALEMYRTGAEKFTPEAAQEYMSPYQRAVTDIEKREAQKVFERDIMPRFEQQAVAAGGMSGLGSRAGVQAGQLGQAQIQQMGDIEAKGLQRAYMDAQKLFADQKARERQLAGDVGRTGPAMLQAGLAEQGILQDIGQQEREMVQGALDEAYYKFLKEEAYPQDILASYSGTTYGASPFVGPSGTKTTTGGPQPYRQSPGQQLLGLGMAGLNIYGMGGGFKPGSQFSGMGALNKMFGGKSGGTIGGLSDLPVVRRQSGGRQFRSSARPRVDSYTMAALGNGNADEGIVPKRKPPGGRQFRSSARPRIVPKRKPPTPRYSYRHLAKQHELDLLKGGDYPHPSPDEIDIDIIGRGLVGVDKGQRGSGSGGMTGLTGTSPTITAGTSPTISDADKPLDIAEILKDLGTDWQASRGKSRQKQLQATEARLKPIYEKEMGDKKKTFSEYQTSLKKLQTQQNKQRKAKREGYNASDKKASEEFFSAREAAIKAGNNVNRLAGAMDKATQRQMKHGAGNVLTWATDVMNITAREWGEDQKQTQKDLAELAKAKYKEARTDRKTQRAENLEDDNREFLEHSNSLIREYGFEEKMLEYPKKIREAASAELAADQQFKKNALSHVEVMAKLMDTLAKRTSKKGKPVTHTAELKLITEKVARKYNYLVDEHGNITLPNGQFLTKDDPNYQNIQNDMNAAWKIYLDEQDQTNPKVAGFLKILPPVGSGTQAGGGTPPANYSNAKKAPDGNWYIPDPNRPGKFLKVS